LWVLHSGAHWHDLPERYGKWKTAHKRFTRWAKAGVWAQVFEARARDNQYLMLDSTSVRGTPEGRRRKRGLQSGSGPPPPCSRASRRKRFSPIAAMTPIGLRKVIADLGAEAVISSTRSTQDADPARCRYLSLPQLHRAMLQHSKHFRRFHAV
jgi:transposase